MGITKEDILKNGKRVYVRCDKCGEEVPENNNAVTLDGILYGDWTLVFAEPRHLLPTENCPGSPSRAQYIEGQKRDERSQYAYVPVLEPVIREAYEKLQKIAEKE